VVTCLSTVAGNDLQQSMADPKILKKGMTAPSSFIANAHNEIYAFYTEKAGLKKYEPIGGRPPHRPNLNPPLTTIE